MCVCICMGTCPCLAIMTWKRENEKGRVVRMDERAQARIRSFDGECFHVVSGSGG